jgi:hypothetical protein
MDQRILANSPIISRRANWDCWNGSDVSGKISNLELAAQFLNEGCDLVRMDVRYEVDVQ